MSYDQELERIRQQQEAALAQQQATEQSRINAQTQNSIDLLNARKPLLEQRFSDNAQQAYINKQMSLKNLPQQLAAQGYNGGLSETANLRLDTNYGNNYTKYQRDYNSDVNDIENQVTQARFQGNDLQAQSNLKYMQAKSDSSMKYNTMLADFHEQERLRQLQLQAELEKEKRQEAKELAKSRQKQVNEKKAIENYYRNLYGDDYVDSMRGQERDYQKSRKANMLEASQSINNRIYHGDYIQNGIYGGANKRATAQQMLQQWINSGKLSLEDAQVVASQLGF